MGDPTLIANMATAPSGKIPHNFYLYKPSQALAIVYCLLYILLVPLHSYLSLFLSRRKTHPASPAAQHKNENTILLVLSAALSAAGFGVRAASVQSQNQTNSALYIVSNALIIVSPILICATLYFMLSDLIRRYLPATSLGVKVKTQRFLGLPPTFLSLMFIGSDVLSLLTQAGGMVIFVNSTVDGLSTSAGRGVLLFGLTLQIATFSIFLVILIQFYLRTREFMKYRVTADKWGVVVVGMYVAGALVMIRTFYRTLAFAAGVNGYPLHHEWTIYVFDALPTWFSLAALAYWHPARWLSGVPGEYNLVQAESDARLKAETRYK